MTHKLIAEIEISAKLIDVEETFTFEYSPGDEIELDGEIHTIRFVDADYVSRGETEITIKTEEGVELSGPIFEVVSIIEE